jgi:GNAT superfamily N-acetyltransferase
MPISPLVSLDPAVLRDGAAVDVRATTPDDERLLVRFHEELSQESRFLRFLFLGASMGACVRRLLAPEVAGLVALAGTRAVGHGCLVPTGAGTAELAFAIADDWQGRGVGTVLLERLVAEGGARGLTTLTAEVHPSNHRMISVFEDAGMPVTVRAEAGTLHVEIPAGVTPEVREHFEQRHRRAAVAGSTICCAPRRSR